MDANINTNSIRPNKHMDGETPRQLDK